jgi:spore maturation protein CgeB
MRVIEATGAGAFLITNAHPDLVKFFEPGKELETFSNADELINKIRHYLAHDDARRAIAAKGRARCLKDHSMAASAAQFRAMIEAKLAAKILSPS